MSKSKTERPPQKPQVYSNEAFEKRLKDVKKHPLSKSGPNPVAVLLNSIMKSK
jgi:hypothetical protein